MAAGAAQRGPGSWHTRPSQQGVALQNWPTSEHCRVSVQIVALQNNSPQHGMNEQDVPTSEHSPATVVLDPAPPDEELDEPPPLEDVPAPEDPAVDELPPTVEEALVVASAPVDVTAAVGPAGSLLSSPQANRVAQ